MSYLAFLVFTVAVALFAPSNTFAATPSQENVYEQTFYVADIGHSFEASPLNFEDIRFVDHSSTTAESFGLTGETINDSSEPVNYKIYVKYYTEHDFVAATSYTTKTAEPGTSYFAMMSDESYLSGSGYSVESIDHYDIVIYILDSQEETDFAPSNDLRYSSEDYVIDGYDIDVVVNEDRTFTIREHITAYFDPAAGKHGIIRKIPLSGTLTRNNGATSNYHARVTDKNVGGDPYTTSHSDGYLNIKIGSASSTVSGEHEYDITYTYNMGKDPLEGADELYLDLIGTDWDTVIGNITFSIHMPKSFDASKLGFSVGEYGSTNSDDVMFNISGNDISGSYRGILDKYQGLTVRLELPEGYFVGAGFKTEPAAYLAFAIPALCLIVAFIIWYLVGRDTNKKPEAIEFYPPEGVNSLNAGFYYKGKVDNNSVISLLIYLANKGYIGIVESKSGRSYQIVKLKEYDGDDENERDFMKGLFENAKPQDEDRDEIIEAIRNGEVPTQATADVVKDETSLDVVKPRQLRVKFYTTIDKITERMNKKANVEKIMHNTRWASVIVSILCILSLISTLVAPYVAQGRTYEVSEILVYGLFMTPFMVIFLASEMSVLARIIYACFTALLMIGVLGAIDFFSIIFDEAIYVLSVTSDLICAGGILICCHCMPKRTPYGAKMYAKVSGFRRFLETAEKDQIELIGNENPHYYYDILPYMYALDISDKYMKKFEDIAKEEPEWYTAYNYRIFSGPDFARTFNRNMAKTVNYMTTRPSSSGGSSSSGGFSSGGSSGGGFSGGGGGGGGGSSW